MCQETNHNQKKQKEKSDLRTEKGLKSSVITVNRKSRYNLQLKQKEIIATFRVMQKTGKKIGNRRNSHLGKGVLLDMRHIEDGSILTQNIWRTSKLEDMHGNETPRAHTLLSNGRNSKKSSIISVLYVWMPKNLRKIISNLFPSEEQITFKTSNHYAEIVTAGSGRSFNIYENKELLK